MRLPNIVENNKSMKKINYSKRQALIMLSCFALNSFSLNIGCYSPIFSRLCGILALIGILILYFDIFLRTNRNNIPLLPTAIILASMVVVLLSLRIELWLVSLPIFLSGLDLFFRTLDKQVEDLRVLTFGSLIYLIIYTIINYAPAIWTGINGMVPIFTDILGRLLGSPLALGPTASGVWILLTFISYSIAYFTYSERNQKDIKIILILLFFLILFSSSFACLYDLPGIGELSPAYLSIAFLFFSVPFLIFIPKFEIIPMPECSGMQSWKTYAALGTVFFILLSMMIFPYSTNKDFGNIVFYEKNCVMNFDLPKFPKNNESFGPDSGFSAGVFEQYLETVGHNVVKYNNSNHLKLVEVLGSADLLVMMNINKSLPSDDLEAIWSFIRRGGGLMIFGEHTRMFVENEDFLSGKDFLNEILKPTGIRVNPDTADYFPGNWKYAAVAYPHSVTRNLGFELTTSSVGASLNISGNARPVIVGRYGFSDNAEFTTPGHLGNRRYETGERLGDLVVAASDNYGLGNVLVFGDTSYVLNPEVSTDFELIDNSITWLLSSCSKFLTQLHIISMILLCIFILGFLFRGHSFPTISSSFLALASITIAFSIIVAGGINGSLMKNPGKEEADIAWIDHTHLNQFDLNGYTPGSIDGLTTNMIRNGFTPLVLDKGSDFEDILAGKVVIIIGPNKIYTQEETSILKDFVDDGGLLIISSGYANSPPLRLILESFNMSIASLPLGSPPWIVETHGQTAGTVTAENLKRFWHKPKFIEAYPVGSNERVDIISSLQHSGSNYSLAISKPYGKGEILLVGDSRFLLNENLEYLSMGPEETKENYQLQWLGNIELLKAILDRYKEGKT